VDDEDQGDEVIYTGRGGRDQKTGRQVEDQEFEGQNAALVVSRREGLPVRVVRGAGTMGRIHQSVAFDTMGFIGWRITGASVAETASSFAATAF
jgi:SAD/SRA domain